MMRALREHQRGQIAPQYLHKLGTWAGSADLQRGPRPQWPSGLFRRPSRPSPASPSPRQTRAEGVLGSSHGQALGLVGLHGTRICGGLGTHQGWTSPGTRPEATEPALSGSLSRLAGHIIMLLYTEHTTTGGSTRTLHYLLCTMYLVSLKYLCRGSSLFLEQG